MVKWELDLWYELWERAGGQGLDTWYDPRSDGVDGKVPASDTGNVADPEPDGA